MGDKRAAEPDKRYTGVAQWLMRRIFNPRIAGSTPVAGTFQRA